MELLIIQKRSKQNIGEVGFLQKSLILQHKDNY